MLRCPEGEALVQIEKSRATRKNIRNMPNIEIANRIVGQRKWIQNIQQKKITNIVVFTKKGTELQLLADHQFKKRIIKAMRNITTMQQHETNAVNDNNNSEMDRHSSTSPPEEEPPD